jgi:hypothetical protein
MTYTIQVSNHPGALARPISEAASRAWTIVYDGRIESDAAARKAAVELTGFYRFVRVFKHAREIGYTWLELDAAVISNG